VRELRGYALVRPANAASEPLSSIGAAHTAAEEAQAAAEAASAASAASAAAASAPPKPARGPHRKTR
jgi:hypothetical protein